MIENISDKMLQKSILKLLDPKETPEVAVLLSGGVDSLSCAFALHREGFKVSAYSFFVKGNESYDFLKAQEAAKEFGWKFTPVELDFNSQNAERILTELRDEYMCIKKTHYECIWPLVEALKLIKEKDVFMGYSAETYYGSSRRNSIAFRHAPKDAFDVHREKWFWKGGAEAKLNLYVDVFTKFGKNFRDPYRDIDVYNFFIQFGLNELRKPHEKHHIRESFKPELDRLGKVKPHWNYQKCAGIDVQFENVVLPDLKLNKNNRKRMMDFYRDFNREVNHNTVPLPFE